MTQTLGQYLVNELLPDDLKVTGPIDKRDLHKKLYALARRDPKDYVDRVDKLRRLGHELATTEGITVGLDDIAPDYAKRDRIIKPALKQLKKTRDPVRRQKIIAKARDALLKITPSHPGSMGMMLRAGARGKPVQLMRTVNAPVETSNIAGPIPWMIGRSYSEGLKPSEIWATNAEARMNLLDANLAVTEPGDLSKILVSNMSDQLILTEDCGTSNGIVASTEGPDAIERFLARAQHGFSRNTLVTARVLAALRKKTKTCIVRSPMTCESHDGICTKCYGNSERGQLQPLGTNVGMRSAQALTRPLTLFVLGARHGVRGETKGGGLEGFRQFLEIPESFASKAILSPVDGRISKIETAPQGGINIGIGDENLYAPPGQNPIVRIGQNVTPGDALTDGVPKPDEVVRYKGLGAGRKYMVDRLHDVYARQGVDIDKRHLEILAKTHLNHVQVEEDPGERFFPGEIVNYTTMLKHLAKDTEHIPIEKAEGRMLSRGQLHHMAGTLISPEIGKELKRHDVGRVDVVMQPPRLTPVMRPITRNPLLASDWMARLGHRFLRTSLTEGAHFGEQSNIHGTHPVPAYAYGVEFGRGKGGRY